MFTCTHFYMHAYIHARAHSCITLHVCSVHYESWDKHMHILINGIKMNMHNCMHKHMHTNKMHGYVKTLERVHAHTLITYITYTIAECKRVCIQQHAYMHTCEHTCVQAQHIHRHVHGHKWRQSCTLTCMHAYTHTYLPTCMHACMCKTNTHSCRHAYRHTDVYRCFYIHCSTLHSTHASYAWSTFIH